MIVGPAIPSAITFMCWGASARANSSRTIAWCVYGAPWPPYSSGHVSPAYPASYSLRLHSLPGSPGRFTASHSRTSARKAASSGPSRRSIAATLQPSCCRDDPDSATGGRLAPQRHAGARRARDEPALVVEHVALGEADRPTAADHASACEELPRPERPQEVDLQLERRERLAVLEGREEGRAHRGVGQVAENPAVDRA